MWNVSNEVISVSKFSSHKLTIRIDDNIISEIKIMGKNSTIYLVIYHCLPT